MKAMNSLGRKIMITATTCLCACLVSCINSDGECTGSGDRLPRTFLLSYEIPDAETSEAPATRAAGTTPSTGTENVIDHVRVLFFERDDYGNGAYIGSLSGQHPNHSLENVGELEITLADPVKADTDYNVLVIANADKYIAPAQLEAFCQSRTENLVKIELLPVLEAGVADGLFTVPDGCLPMSATGVKAAEKGLKVTLLRAAVRIDVKTGLPDGEEKITIEEAQVANILPAVPLFCDPRPMESAYLWGTKKKLTDADNNEIKGGLYAMETYNTPTDRGELITRRTCLLVKCHTESYTGSRCWYRIDINVAETETEGQTMQYLKRNNVYVVRIDGIRSLGAGSAEEAYYSDATLIASVTIPGKWQDSGLDTPDADVN